VALRLVAEALAARPDRDETAELRLVEAGARQDLGESAAARLVLEDALGGRPTPESLTAGADPARIRLAAAYADLLDAVGEAAAAERWRSAVLGADPEGATGAVERPEVEFDELDEDEAPADEDELPAGDGSDAPGAGTGDSAESEVEPDIEPDLDDDIEAEVAELLGEDPPAR
jgi:hypothetical protein